MNLIIDTSYIARKNAWIRSSGPDCFSNKEERDQLCQSLLVSVDYIARRYNKIDRIIFAFDTFNSKSWRFDLPYKDIYKANRKPSNRYNGIGFKIALQEFKDYLDANGICTLMYERAEGDDMIYIASNLLFNAKESSIIVTADRDMIQLIKNDGENYIFVYDNDSKKNTHYVDKIAVKADHEVMSINDFFNSDPESNNKQIIYEHAISVIPDQYLMTKIISGDKSDNIPSCYYYTLGKRLVGFTELRANKIFEEHYQDDFIKKEKSVISIFNNKEELENLAKLIQSVNSTPTRSIDEIVANLKVNKDYVHLDYHSYPVPVYDAFEDYVISQLSKPCANTISNLIQKENE